tara:strand:+ start:82 stop:435 length:354 start_codon:yes stop_codon:yes gene_type:complete
MKNKVIFDNQCSLCRDIKNKLELLDRSNEFEWVASDEYINSKNKNKNITKSLIDKTIVVIKENKNILTEFTACRYIISKIRIFYPILLFLYIPYISNYIGNKIYRKIAKSRKCRTTI